MNRQFDRFSVNAKKSLIKAQEIAANSKTVIDTAIFMLALANNRHSTAGNLLYEIGLDNDKLAGLAITSRKFITPGEIATGLSLSAQRALEAAVAIAHRLGQDYVGTEHLLLAIITITGSEANDLLKRAGIDPKKVKTKLEDLFREDEQGYASFEQGGVNPASFADGKDNDKQTVLERFSVDLTKAAKEGKIDPVVGRDKETSRIISILNRRTKNNPVLIGEPGVGKTAIVEGLAQKIADENVPEVLLNKRLLILDLPSVVAGTKYRGEFEEKLLNVISEAKKDQSIILFIDEIHNLVGAGAAEGAIDAANILKPALSRGELQVIGATTFDEYRRHIEKDAALERRFQPILVAEPNFDETIKILQGLRGKFEEHHRVTITDQAVEAAVRLANRYISDRFLPDKAIDLIDEAASLQRIKRGNLSKGIITLQKEIKAVIEKKEEAVLGENFQHAAELKQRENILNARLNAWRKRTGLDDDSKPLIDEENIAEVISISTGIPVTRLVQKESESLLHLEEDLKKKIIGQDEAIKVIANAIRRARTGVSDSRRPIGTFIFLGPTGVGKTELAKVLSNEVFGSPEALVKVDMSEFMEKHNVSRLIGAPAGYVGYEDSGQLTETIRRRPYSVVLLDEIEKAHHDVFNILLQILEDGYLTDAKGVKVDFRNTIVVMTSNIGADRLSKEVSLGFSASTRDQEKILISEHQKNVEFITEDLKKHFRPEFLNRLDKTVVFRALSVGDMKKIVNLQLGELQKRLNEQKIAIKVTEGAKKLLVEFGYDLDNGARPLRRVIQNMIEDPLARGILSGEFEKGDTISILKEGKEIRLFVLETAKK